MMNPTKVLVTGGAGFIASWLVFELLREGHSVNTTMRTPEKHAAHLKSITQSFPGTLEIFKSDMLDPQSLLEPMKNCSIVFHTASPFFLYSKNPKHTLLKPAVEGTQNVLSAVENTPSVRRIILTSSIVAAYDNNKKVHESPNGKVSESNWNTTSSLIHNPYYYSKVQAERKAWDIASKQQRYDLISILPSVVIGPGLYPDRLCESHRIVQSMGNGELQYGTPNLAFGFVDVREVATAHLKAGFSSSAQGRHITSAHNYFLPKIAEILHQHFGKEYPIPTTTLPSWLVWLFGPLFDKAITRKNLSLNLGYLSNIDNAKSIEELGMHYRPLETTLVDTFQWMIEQGHLKKQPQN